MNRVSVVSMPTPSRRNGVPDVPTASPLVVVASAAVSLSVREVFSGTGFPLAFPATLSSDSRNFASLEVFFPLPPSIAKFHL